MGLFSRWPLLTQLTQRTDGTGEESMSSKTRALSARIKGSETARSICPYCAVGCGQLIHHKGGEILAIEGDPESPISGGTLCPKGAACKELLTHDKRLQRVLYRAPRAREWREMNLEEAVDLVAERVWDSRRRTFHAKDDDGNDVRHTDGVAHLGGATLDNEENYLIKKLFTGGLGMVAVSNQARI